MKALRKFNNYLLENHPLLWHTRTIQLTVASVFVWIISFFSGYFSLNLSVLRDRRVESYYENSGFVLFHVALGLIIVAIWALQFYKNNAFKSFYPIGRLYFHKMFLLLFIPFLFLITAIIPFNYGTRLKTKTILSETELEKDYEIIQLAEAFIPTNSSNYHIDHKVFPGPFPLSSVKFKRQSHEWDERYLKISIKDSLSGKNTFQDYSYNPQFTTDVDGNKFQFYKTKLIHTGPCSSQWVLSKNYVFNEQKDHLQLFSIWNFRGAHFLEHVYPLAEKFERIDFREFYAPRVQELANNKDWKGIEKIINDAIGVFNKYKVHHTLNSKPIAQYLKEKDFLKIEDIIEPYPTTERGFRNKLRAENMTINDFQALTFVKQMEFYPTQYFQNDEINQIYSNYNYTYQSIIDKDALVFFLFFALSLTLVLVYFQIVKPIPFLISLPVWGVLFICVGLYFAFSRNGSLRVTHLATPFIILFLFIQIANYLLLKSNIRKSLLNISVSMAIVSAGFLLPFIQGVLNYWSRTRVPEPCGGFKYEYFLGEALISPIIIWLGAFVGIMLALFLAKPWLAKADSN